MLPVLLVVTIITFLMIHLIPGYPARIMAKAKKDWCMALTHGLEHLCENKPKEKRSKKKNSDASEQLLNLE